MDIGGKVGRNSIKNLFLTPTKLKNLSNLTLKNYHAM